MPTDSFSVTTINVNGIRAAVKRGMSDWLKQECPDVLLLQEVRAPVELAQDLIGPDYQVRSYACDIKGRAGVLVAVRPEVEIVDERRGLPGDDSAPAHTGRWLEVDINIGRPLTVVSTYFHSGEVDTPKQELKMDHLHRAGLRMTELLNAGNSLVAGDFNVVRSEKDIKNWKPNHNKRAGVLDEEIAYLNTWAEAGWVDAVRHLAGDSQGPYSWWSWRGKAFDNDAGWRIDYQYVTPELGSQSLDYSIYRAPTWDQRFSDHAPVTVRYQR